MQMTCLVTKCAKQSPPTVVCIECFSCFFQFLASSESIRWFVPEYFKMLDQIFKTILLDEKIIGVKEKQTFMQASLAMLSFPNGNFAIEVSF